MNKKKKISQKTKKRAQPSVGKQAMTPLQTTAVTVLMVILLIISINSVITYGSDRQLDENIFINSQTVNVINQQ